MSGPVVHWFNPAAAVAQLQSEPPPSADNPPFSHRGRLAAMAVVLTLWQPGPPTPIYGAHLPKQLSPAIPGQSVDNPPRIARARAQMQAVVGKNRHRKRLAGGGAAFVEPAAAAQPHVVSYVFDAWQVAPTHPQQRRLLSPGIPGQSADPPPRMRATYVQPPDEPPQPQQRRLLSPGIPGQSADPPPRLRVAAGQYPDAPSLTFYQRRPMHIAVAVAVDAPPQFRAAFQVTAWLPPDPQPQQKRLLSPGIPGQSVDNPPGIARDRATLHQLTGKNRHRKRIAGGGAAFVEPVVIDDPPRFRVVYNPYQWLPPDPPPQQKRLLSPAIPGQSVDDPPGISRKRAEMNALVGKNRHRKRVAGGGAAFVAPVQVDDPPRFRAAFLASLWQPPQPLPQQKRLLSPGIPGQSIDNPPSIDTALIVLKSDTLPAVFYRRPIALVPIAAPAVVNDPPVRRSNWNWSVYIAWHVPPAPTLQPRYFVRAEPAAPAPQFVPFARRWLVTVASAWEPPAIPVQQRQRLLSPGIPGQSVDAPPPVKRSYSYLSAWQIADPHPQQPTVLVPIPAAPAQVDDPPPRRAFWYGAVYHAWHEPPYPAQQPRYMVRAEPGAVPDTVPPRVPTSGLRPALVQTRVNIPRGTRSNVPSGTRRNSPGPGKR